MKDEKIINIGILEIMRHTSILYTFMKICKTNKTKVTVFTTKSLYSDLKSYNFDKNDYEFVIKKNNEGNRSFIKRVQKICDERIDLLFVNTIHETIFDLMSYISFKPKCKKILVLHHVNSWLKPKIVIKLTKPLRTLDTNLSSFLIKCIVLPKFDAVNVIYKPMRKYILENIDFKKEIFTLPTSFFENFNIINKKDTNKIKIVIPGLVQEHRKDFTYVIPAIKNILPYFKDNVEVCLLGTPIGPFGRKIYNSFKIFKDEGYNIILFDKLIDENIFNENVKDSDIILAPIKIKSRADGEIQEFYGKTVGSGVIYNAVMYAKPIIIPKDFEMLEEFNSSTLRYENEKDLEALLKELIIKNDKLQKLKDEAIKNSKKYSMESFQEYFERDILSWLKNNQDL